MRYPCANLAVYAALMLAAFVLPPMPHNAAHAQSKLTAAKVTKAAKAAKAKEAKAGKLVTRLQRLISQYNKLNQRSLKLAKKYKANKAKLKKLHGQLKQLSGQVGTVYARKKPCPLGKKGKSCRLARKLERLQRRLDHHNMKSGWLSGHKIK